MKKNLVDISLTELREFIKNLELSSHFNVSGLSLISVKLRLQFLILQNQFTGFSSFYKFYLENEDYRVSVNLNIVVQANELFRDAEHWDIFVNKIKNSPTTINICLFESGNFYDTVTLLICLERFELLHKINLTVVNLVNNYPLRLIHEFTDKDMEMGIINFSALKSSNTLTDFIKKHSNKYRYIVSNQLAINALSIESLLISDFKYDALIARNITLNYNFVEHEKIFNNYLLILKSKGVLFTGNKEGFKWCSQFKSLTYTNKSIPIYQKL